MRFTGKRAFTLLEILLAISISGIVMTSVCALLFNMVKIMEKFEDEDSFTTQVDNIETFLKFSFANSEFSSEVDETLKGTSFSDNPYISISRPPSFSSMDNMLLCFGVKEDHPFYPSKNGFSAEKVCWLEFDDDEGLRILWCFVDQDEDDSSFGDERTVYESPITKDVKELIYMYNYETQGWVEETEIKEGSDAESQLPSLIKITFKRKNETIQRSIPIFSIVDPTLYSPTSYESSSSASSSSTSSGTSGGGGGGAPAGGGGGGAPAGGGGGGAPAGGGGGGAPQ